MPERPTKPLTRRDCLGAAAGMLLGRAAAAVEPFDLQRFLDDAARAAGTRRIVVPPGRYRVTPRDRRQHLVLRGLRDVEIVADDVEMVCTEITRALTIEDCRNVTVRGLTIDYDPLPFTQGRITALSDDRRVHTIALFDGYPDAVSAANDVTYEIFDPATRTLRSDTPPPEKIEAVDARTLRVTWPRPAAARAPVQVGDLAVIGSEHAPGGGGRMPHAVLAHRCAGLTLERVAVFAANGCGFFETDCDSTTYRQCRVDRRPAATDPTTRAAARLRSVNGDAFHSTSAARGPTLDRCVGRFSGGDAAVNIHGAYHMVTVCHKNELRVLANERIFPLNEPLELWSYDGARLPDAVAVKIEAAGKMNAAERAFVRAQRLVEKLRTDWDPDAFAVTLDRAVDLPPGSLIAPTRRMGSGFRVTDGDFGPGRGRGIVVRASEGRIAGNRIGGTFGPAILVAPDYGTLESGCSRGVAIENNVLADGRSLAVSVEAVSGAGPVAPSGAHADIAIRGNTITGGPLPCIAAAATSGLIIENNTLTPSPDRLPDDVLRRLGLAPAAADLAPIMTVHCAAPTLKDNRILNAKPAEASLKAVRVVTALLVLLCLSAAGCRTSPGYTPTTVTTDRQMQMGYGHGQPFAWMPDRETRAAAAKIARPTG